MIDSMRPLISRLIGACVGALAGIASVKLGVAVDPATQTSITTAVVVGVYGVAHKVLDRHVNPVDAARI